MIKQKVPTIIQANIIFFILAVVTLISSAFFQPKLGLGTNLWINEFIYILFPPLFLARINGWTIENVYRFKKTSVKNSVISILSGFSLWFFAFYVSKIIRILLDKKIGILTNHEQIKPSIYQSLLLMIGIIVLAPICEEIFFRGFVQKAYENHSKRYGFVITGIIFGYYHIFNGISEVIPACILGVAMGYLAYKTNSILTSMFFHAAANTFAAVFGGTFEMFSQAVVPAWMHIISFLGLFIFVVLISHLEGENQPKEDEYKLQKDTGISLGGVVFLVLSALFLTTVGIIEILVRLGIL